MNWTKDTPTKGGIYWMRGDWVRADSDTGDKAPDVVEFVPDIEGDGFAVYFIGSDAMRYRNELPDNLEWAGPLEPPKD